jgi:SAM-dependent methyltransferase
VPGSSPVDPRWRIPGRMEWHPYGNGWGMASAAGDRTFWEQRLAEDWNEAGVGYRALGLPFNTWMYRVRREVFLREVGALDLDLGAARVLDVGSGTGFYIRRWLEAGVASVTGCDLTQSAVDRLRSRFPGVEIHRTDIADPDDAIPRASFDAVSCIDVLFHITDDARYRDAVHHLAGFARPGGYVLLSENFVHGPEQRGSRQVNRTMDAIEGVLRSAGLEPVRRVPMLVLMNAQVDAPRVRRKAWGAFLRGVTVTRPTGWLAGAALFPAERRLVRRMRESPTTELLICRRVGSG